jgi:hypothetical protein
VTATATPTAIIAPIEAFNVFAWPNPVAGDTPVVFQYDLPTMDVRDVEIRIYTPAMRHIRTIMGCPRDYGTNRVIWDRRDFDLNDLSNGLYYYVIVAHQEVRKSRKVGKLVILR